MSKIALAASLVIIGASAEHVLANDWPTGPFQEPESAIHDADRDRIIVSNIAGHPGEADGVGFLSLVAPDGAILEPNWVEGLDAPKGMAILGDQLLVADLTQLRVVDLATGALESLHAPSAVFLNDIAVIDDVAYITDFMDHAIYTYDGTEVSRWLETEDLAHPNGIAAHNGELLIASWGQDMNPDFTTTKPGHVLRVSVPEGEVTKLTPVPIGNLDGIVVRDARILVNDWLTGMVFDLTMEGQINQEFKKCQGLADISDGPDGILLPCMNDGIVDMTRF